MKPRFAKITGSSRGIGAALLALLSASDPSLTILAISRSRPGTLPPNAHFLACDLSCAAAVSHLCAHLVSILPTLSLLLNNGATCPSFSTAAAFEAAYATNAAAPTALAAALAPRLAAGNGVVLNISSGDGELAFCGTALAGAMRSAAGQTPAQAAAVLSALVARVAGAEDDTWGVAGGQAAYRFSKACLNALTRAMAGEGGFVVAAVCPGDVDTEMGDAGAERSTDEAARGILELAERLRIGAVDGGCFYRDGEVIEW